MKIDWKVPDARKGLLSGIDKLIGPGATKSEKNLQFYIPIIAGLSMLAYAYLCPLSWGWEQYFIAGLLTVDIVGGIITNATSSAKRWFHREGQSFAQHMGFVGTHFVQLVLFSWAFLGFDVMWMVIAGGYMWVACAIILKTPLYLQRPVAMTLYSLSLIISMYILDGPEGLEWFLPLFYLKLLVSHVLREEPYRPESD